MEQLRLSRNTIVYAFERLVTEGYLESKPGSGTYVAPVHGGMHGRDTGDVRSRTRSYGQRRLSARAAVLAGARISPEYSSALLRPFRPCQPAVDVFSLRTWNRARSSALRSASEHLLFLNDPAGLPRLRQTLCVYLRDARGVRCEPDQIIVTSGSQQALTLLASTLIDPGDAIWIEDPGYLGAPEHRANALRTAKEVDDGACPAVDQATVAVLIEEGAVASHVRRMRALYAERRDAFLREARRRLSGLVTFPDVEAGMDAIGWLASATDDTAVSRRLGA